MLGSSKGQLSAKLGKTFLVGAAATYLVGAAATYLVGAAASYLVQAENKANSAQLSWGLS